MILTNNYIHTIGIIYFFERPNLVNKFHRCYLFILFNAKKNLYQAILLPLLPAVVLNLSTLLLGGLPPIVNTAE